MPLVPIIAAMLVLAVGMSVLAEPPRPVHAPPRLTWGGDISSFVRIVPAVAAHLDERR